MHQTSNSKFHNPKFVSSLCKHCKHLCNMSSLPRLQHSSSNVTPCLERARGCQSHFSCPMPRYDGLAERHWKGYATLRIIHYVYKEMGRQRLDSQEGTRNKQGKIALLVYLWRTSCAHLSTHSPTLTLSPSFFFFFLLRSLSLFCC